MTFDKEKWRSEVYSQLTCDPDLDIEVILPVIERAYSEGRADAVREASWIACFWCPDLDEPGQSMVALSHEIAALAAARGRRE